MADVCEHCEDPAEYDVLVDGCYLRVCRKCLNDDMVIMTKPTKDQVNFSYKRPTVNQILRGMSGMPAAPADNRPNQVPAMSLLRQPSNDSMMRKRLTNLKLESPDQGSQMIKEREPKLSPFTKEDREKIESEDEYLDI